MPVLTFCFPLPSVRSHPSHPLPTRTSRHLFAFVTSNTPRQHGNTMIHHLDCHFPHHPSPSPISCHHHFLLPSFWPRSQPTPIKSRDPPSTRATLPTPHPTQTSFITHPSLFHIAPVLSTPHQNHTHPLPSFIFHHLQASPTPISTPLHLAQGLDWLIAHSLHGNLLLFFFSNHGAVLSLSKHDQAS